MRRLDKPTALAEVARATASLPESLDGCVPCALARGVLPRRVVVERDGVWVLLERFAVRRGHLVVVPEEHATGVAQLSSARWAAIQQLAWRATVAVERALSPRRTFVASLGTVEDVPTSFPHVHVHVLPVFEAGADARPSSVLSWGPGVFVYDDDEADDLVAALRASVPD